MARDLRPGDKYLAGDEVYHVITASNYPNGTTDLTLLYGDECGPEHPDEAPFGFAFPSLHLVTVLP